MANFNDVNYEYLGIEGLTGGYMSRVTNLSNNRVLYVLPELNITREFQGATAREQDTKTISFHELYTLKNSPGGEQLIWDNLQIKDNAVRQALGLPSDPEFSYSIDDIRKLVVEGSEDEILDALEFGPYFIATQIKNYLVTEEPKIDYGKIRLFEGLFHMQLQTLRDNFEWAKLDENVGTQYKAMDTSENTARGERRANGSSKELTPDDLFPERGTRRVSRQ